MKSKKIIEFVPFFVMAALSAVTLCIYIIPMHGRTAFRIIQVAAAPLISLIVPIINRIFKIKIPFAFNIAVSAFAFFAMNLAAVFLYNHVKYVDKIEHTLFGILGGFGVMILLLYGKGEKLKPWCFFICIMLGVLGVAALWEIYEYVASMILKSDLQKWLPDMSKVGDMTVSEFFKTYNPMWDTMWDIIVALFGVIIFYAIIFIDKLCGYKLCKSIYRQVNYKKFSSNGADGSRAQDDGGDEEKASFRQ